MAAVLSEQAKYEAVWNHPEYRRVAPGEHAALAFIQQFKPQRGESCIDFGCGTGRGSVMLATLGGLRVTMLDFAANCLDAEAKELADEFPDKLKFVQHDLTQPYEGRARYGFCTDVMEHLPTEDVPKVLRNILDSARNVFFQISCVDDVMGALIGEPLHLTVKPHSWWLEQFNALDCHVRYSHDGGAYCLFYVSAYANGADIVKRSSVNVEPDVLAQHVRENVRLGVPEVKPYDTQDVEIMILAGGPSINDFEAEIIAKRGEGMPLVTVNGAYHWAIERGLKPSAQIVLDAREFNKRFVSPVVEGCKYLVASQCHPETVKASPQGQTFLWHSGDGQHVKDALAGVEGEHYPVHGGATVMLRAIPLLRMLGFCKFHIYGWDSCLREDTHHGYAQPENDAETVMDITVFGKTFRCHPWMAAQAQEFIGIQRMLPDDVQLAVYGDGIISWIIEQAGQRGLEEP